jgi:hypothetical protein
MDFQHWLAAINPLRLLRGLLYAAMLGAAVQETGWAGLGSFVLLVVAVAFGGLLVVLVERSRRCLD